MERDKVKESREIESKKMRKLGERERGREEEREGEGNGRGREHGK